MAGIKIVSGGQTGADRAALDFAIAHGLPHGGWCPKGRKCEEGTIAACYQLQESPSSNYVQRTEWNVRDSDGTVIFSIAPVLTGGSKKTLDLARKHHKPVIHISREEGPVSPAQALKRFIAEHRIKVLNVAGPRASKEPEVASFVRHVLEITFELACETGTTPRVVEQPTLDTARLILRPLALDDAPVLAKLAGRREIADTTISIPHPYSEEKAKEWIKGHIEGAIRDKEVVFAVLTKADRQLVGTIGLRDIDQEHSQAEMGFWVAVECWRQGYATEAGRRVLQFGFEGLKLTRIYAHHMLRNPASGRVLEKIGMRKEGVLRERVRKWGVFEDVAALAILNRNWVGHQRQP